MVRTFLGLAAFVAGLIVSTGTALAQAEDWDWGFQEAVTPIMHEINWFYDMLLVMMVVISALVLVLLFIIVVRFNRRRNQEPSRTSHNTLLEIVWTTVPVLILVAIAVPSLRLLYYEEIIPDADMTLKAIGHQWYWTYEYTDHGEFAFDAIMVPDDELKEGELRLLATDNVVVLPVDKMVRVLVTSEDVIHSWAMPAMGVKTDAVPGRINELWLQIDTPGTYYGQCSELCGELHGFMPIMIEAVSEAEFQAWVTDAQSEFAAAGAPVVSVAENGLAGQ